MSRSQQLGFTLLELIAAMGISAGVMISASGLLLTSHDTASVANAIATLENRLVRTVNRIGREVIDAGLRTFDPPIPGGQSGLGFRKSSGYSAGDVVWGAPTRIEFRASAEDPDDGLDNDGDGFIDEGEVVLVRNPGAGTGLEEEVVWAGGVAEYLEGELPNGLDDNGNGLVDEPGLSFQLAGDTLWIRLTLQQLDNKKRVIERTLETSVRVRN